MRRKNRLPLIAAVLFMGLGLCLPAAAQEMFKEPETILPANVLRLVLDEVSGQRAFNNIAMMAGYNRVRTPEEMSASGIMYEADYLGKVMKGYGLDLVRIESNHLIDEPRGDWWVGHEAELRLVEPEPRLLARLEDQPALVIRNSDSVDCRGELVYLERRDMSGIKDMDLKGKIILTPESGSSMAPAFERGALGVISYNNYIDPLGDPDQVPFDMSLRKGKTKDKVFGLMISIRQGYQLRDMVLQGQKVVVGVKIKAAGYPWKADTVFAAIKGTDPEAKGLMFTAHMFERPAKIGANDNVSGCAALAEVARTLAALINSGRIERPERSIYFLMSEEGSGTAAFFQNHPEMAGKVLADINMDMVGEGLDLNSAFLHIERPFYSRLRYVDSVADVFADYVMQTNVEAHGVFGLVPGEKMPLPIMEKNGSRDSFRYQMGRYSGGSDHGIFLEADCDISAITFIVWPDKWYHTDHDTPDKSDPTQMKRVSFIGACSALAICSGKEDTVMNLARKTYEDRMEMVQKAYADGLAGLSARKALDDGKAYRNALNGVIQAVALAGTSVESVRELVSGKPRVAKYLDGLKAETAGLLPFYSARLSNYYSIASTAVALKAEKPKVSADDAALEKIVPVKTKSVKLGQFFPYTEVFNAIPYDSKSPDINSLAYEKLGGKGLTELFLLFDGKRSLAAARDLLCFEFSPFGSAEFMKLVKAFEKAGLIKLNARTA